MSPTGRKKAAAKAKSHEETRKKSQPAPNSKASEPTPHSNVNVLVWLRAKKGKEVAMERELRRLIGPTRAEPGCVTYALYYSADQPRDFFLHEVWSSQADLAQHWQMPHFKRWVGRQSAVLESRQRYLAE